MSIKESKVRFVYDHKLFGPHSVPVFYTDELITTSVDELARGSFYTTGLEYLFVGYFSNPSRNLNKWFFANAQNHEIMRKAIEEEIGKENIYTYGQFYFSEPLKKDGILRFKKLILHSSPSTDTKESEDIIKRLMKLIDTHDLNNEIFVMLLSEDLSTHSESYFYYKHDGNLKKSVRYS